MNAQKGALALLKDFLIKAVFTVGLCTTAYYSVVKAHQTLFPAKPSLTQGEQTSLRDKVDSLDQNQNLGTIPQGQFTEARPMKANLNKVVEATAEASPAASPVNNMIIQAAVETAVNASPSPSPGEAQVQAQEEVAQNPYGYYPYGYNPYGQYGDNSGGDGSASKDRKDSKSATSDSTNPDQYGIGGQLIVPPKGPVLGGVDISNSGNTVNVTSNLNSQDIQWLISLPIKASVPMAQIPVNGHKPDGSAVQDYQASSTIWNLERGLPELGSTFTIRPNTGGGGAPVQIDVMIQTQTLNSTPMPIAFSLRPTESNAKNDFVNGQAVRVYTFHAPDQVVNNNKDTLLGMTVTLTVAINGANPTLLSGGFTFNRADAKTTSTQWDPSRSPASMNDWITADLLPFQMKLEKSQ
ncbi:MAG: hypothetical protein JST80_00440 [Bdellovibrionales bacterium]|nr:hypothetical protein [Bdellovibrionales bacterium]